MRHRGFSTSRGYSSGLAQAVKTCTRLELGKLGGHVDIVVRGRNVEVPDHYRQLVTEKLTRIGRYDSKIIRTDVELQHEKSPRASGNTRKIEITCRTRGPVVRAEAVAADFYKALDQAVDKIDRKFQKAAERRRDRRRRPVPVPVGPLDDGGLVLTPAEDPDELAILSDDRQTLDQADHEESFTGPGKIVREKEPPAQPMTVEQALYEMELVGHDFYLFFDSETGRPSVVYHRKAYDYGLIRLVE